MGIRKYNFAPNQKINHLVLIEEVYRMDQHRKRKFWRCRCLRCGNIKIIREDQLVTQQSCGCLSKAHRSKWLRWQSKYKSTQK